MFGEDEEVRDENMETQQSEYPSLGQSSVRNLACNVNPVIHRIKCSGPTLGTASASGAFRTDLLASVDRVSSY